MSVNYELRCRECSKTWGNVPRSFCEDCFSPLEVAYDYDALKTIASRENLAGRDFNMWRYSELLPLPEDFTGPNAVGGTPLVASRKLASRWGLKNLYFKNDAVCFPSLSFKDRVVATALSAARRFNFTTVGCSSTGNLANAVAAQAAQQGFDACVFIPGDLEPAKVLNTAVYGARIVRINGNYDHVNRLCAEIAAAIKLLAETEGIFTETAGGVTTGVTQKLIAQNRLKPDETTVVCITGNGLKTTDAIAAEFPASEAIAPRLDAFEAYLDAHLGTAVASAKA